MADVAPSTLSRPRAIPATKSTTTATAGLARLSLDPPNNINNTALPSSSLSASAHTRANLTFPPVTLQGSYDYDRIIKSGHVLKRTRKTKSWKSIFIVLRPNLLSIYRDSSESRLRHQINLVDLTAVARQRDPRRRDKHVFALFSPSRNYHLEATSEAEAQNWVELIRHEARMDDVHEDELELMSPGGATTTAYWGAERSIDAQLSPNQLAHDDRGGYSSSEVEFHHPATAQPPMAASLPKQRDRVATYSSTTGGPRRPSNIEYSGAEHGSFSDFSDAAVGPMSALSLSLPPNDPTSGISTSPTIPQSPHVIYGPSPISSGVGMGQRSASQLSGINLANPSTSHPLHATQARPTDAERVIHQSYLYHLQKKSGPSLRQWKKLWMVLRASSLTLYKSADEYVAVLVLPLSTIIDAVELDPLSRSKTSCMLVIADEKNYRFACSGEEDLAKWLGAFKSVFAARKRAATINTAVAGGVSSAPNSAGGYGVPPPPAPPQS